VFREIDLPSILLIDNEYYARPAGPNDAAMAEFWSTSPYTVVADGPAELADKLGMPAEVVAATVEAFNAAIDGIDPLTGRDLVGVAPLAGRLRAVQFFPMAQKNFGGVRTDLRCRVLDREAMPVPGLYAVGEVAGMAGGSINGIAGLEGTMFGPSLYSGRVAGRSAEF
jgi:succinate dehydrogenase/fumarate reductase flavoprotein subunit